ncbi:substrate-binding periplasmic protein [Thalassospira australica]|uniref:substrate-binding periplasmic protein n=1 Tax=Thalassospira australica TaxID=1528106 RepID=UPI0012E05C0D|nr:hypothetical protein [Thalassospira australica]
MAFRSQMKTVRNCVTVIIIVLAIFLSLQLLPSAQANTGNDDCLRIAFPEASKDSIPFDMYRAVMHGAGVCVDPVRMPNARAIRSIPSGDIDGVFAGLDIFAEQVGVPVVRGVQVGNPDGLLVVPEGTVTTLKDLTSERIGVWLGVTWSEQMLRDYPHLVECPGGPPMMIDMLEHGRVDGLLINSSSLQLVGGVPDGYTSIRVRKLIVHSWLDAEHADVLAQFNAGTTEFLRKIRSRRKNAPCRQIDRTACE